MGDRKHKVVWTIRTRERDGKAFWIRIGAAFENRDGSLNVILDAIPINGKMQIRDYVEPEERKRLAEDRRRRESREDEPPLDSYEFDDDVPF